MQKRLAALLGDFVHFVMITEVGSHFGAALNYYAAGPNKHSRKFSSQKRKESVVKFSLKLANISMFSGIQTTRYLKNQLSF